MSKLFSGLSGWDWLEILSLAAVSSGAICALILRSRKSKISPDENGLIPVSIFFEKEKVEAKQRGWELFWEIVLIAGLIGEIPATKHSISESARLNNETEQLRKANDVTEARVRPRVLQFDEDSAAAFLKGKAKFQVEILYPKDDLEAYDLAQRIMSGLALTSGGWPVSMPRPIVEDDIPTSFLWQSQMMPGEPLLERVGLMYNQFEIVTKNSPTNQMVGMSWELENAISAGFGYGTYGNDFFSVQTDSRLPDNFIRLMVGSSYNVVGRSVGIKLR